MSSRKELAWRGVNFGGAGRGFNLATSDLTTFSATSSLISLDISLAFSQPIMMGPS
jgi:hypothetical protein